MRMPVLVVGVHERRSGASGSKRWCAPGFTMLPVASFLDARDVLTEIEPRGDRDRRASGRLQRPASGGHRPGRAPADDLPGGRARAMPRCSPSPTTSAPAISSSRLPPTALAPMLAELVATPRPQRRWPRKRPVREVPTFVSGVEARIVDVSYGGAGIEFFGAELPGETLELTVPGDRPRRAGGAGLGAPHRARPSRLPAAWRCAATARWTPSGGRSSTASSCCPGILPARPTATSACPPKRLPAARRGCRPDRRAVAESPRIQVL